MGEAAANPHCGPSTEVKKYAKRCYESYNYEVNCSQNIVIVNQSPRSIRGTPHILLSKIRKVLKKNPNNVVNWTGACEYGCELVKKWKG
jgi:hypothetical protein